MLSAVNMPVFFNRRRPTLFVGSVCIFWINTFQLLIRISIATTATISVTRTISLVYPLSHLNKRYIIIALFLYGSCVLSATAIPSIIGIQYSYYDVSGAYCWLMPTEKTFAPTWNHIDNVIDCVALAFPVLPITISCMISIYCVMRVPKTIVKNQYNGKEGGVSFGRGRVKTHATITIIIFTMVYLIFNVPLFIMYVFWYLTNYLYEYPGPFFSTAVMYNYSWNFVEVLSVASNAAINPCLYFIRIKKFRIFLKTRHSPRSNAFEMSTIAPIKNSCVNMNDDVIIIQNSVLLPANEKITVEM